jgi:periplasmic mercuric ion binding protein
MNKLIITIVLYLLSASAVSAQTDTVRIQTSALCDMCKKTIENELSFEKGVKKSTLDLDTKILTVVYNAEKTTPEKIRIAVTKSGYDADSLKADPKAFERLPECCKNPEHEEHKQE